MSNIYSKENLESLVFDLIKYLYRTKDYKDEKLSNNVLFKISFCILPDNSFVISF